MWSTSQVAELAGTTLKTVRHYHRIGLLEEPDRKANGYKQYRVPHLVRLLRIRRLVDLGVPLATIAGMEVSDENAERALRELDAELAADVERKQRMREELARVLRHRALADLPPGFAADAGAAEGERSLLLLFSRVLNPAATAALRELHALPRLPIDAEFDALPADADPAVRQDLAERLAPVARRQREDFPALLDPTPHGDTTAMSVAARGLVEVYNPAQVDVLRRLDALLQGR
ncbi:MerR family transcriptional regulator [Umezawaea tangerina]|uniref:MerR family transcriptional regulator n=1 Tax=Umezawaea tangerina TaxID=84725 RepID=UPI003183BE5F